MFNKVKLSRVLFLDIETTSQYPTFESMPEKMKLMFLKKFKNELENKEIQMNDIESFYDSKAPLYPEYGKIVCISILRIVDEEEIAYKTLNIFGEDEKEVLESFLKKVPSVTNCENPKTSKDLICSHAGSIFDWPYMAKRMIFNSIPTPPMFDFAELKPWDITWFIDTNEAWKHNTFDGRASLDVLAYNFGLSSPKDDMSGEDVKKVYWVEKDLKKIADYCEKDVIALAGVFLKMKGIHKPLKKQ